MTTPSGTTLAGRTTLRVGGPAADWVVVDDEEALTGQVIRCDAAGIPVLLLGGGSNLLVGDDGFPGTVIDIATTGVAVAESGDGRVRLTLAAGEVWDDVVARTVAQGWSGIEALSGIPGRVGATPIQNVGAYGQDVSQVIESVRVLDRLSGTVIDLVATDCGFGYRSSVFKAQPHRWVVLGITIVLQANGVGAVRYPELARELGVAVEATAPVGAVRAAVLALRSRKGMVLAADDPDTWSAGSFFTNPVLGPAEAAALPSACPRFPSDHGTKVSAAWLIEHAGMGPGFALAPDAPAAISGRHALALTNRGTATASDILALAREVRRRVEATFGVELTPEPTLVGCSLDVVPGDGLPGVPAP